jgi:hypothetical protein
MAPVAQASFTLDVEWPELASQVYHPEKTDLRSEATLRSATVGIIQKRNSRVSLRQFASYSARSKRLDTEGNSVVAERVSVNSR